jgi:hypothetical protein
MVLAKMNRSEPHPENPTEFDTLIRRKQWKRITARHHFRALEGPYSRILRTDSSAERNPEIRKNRKSSNALNAGAVIKACRASCMLIFSSLPEDDSQYRRALAANDRRIRYLLSVRSGRNPGLRAGSAPLKALSADLCLAVESDPEPVRPEVSSGVTNYQWTPLDTIRSITYTAI